MSFGGSANQGALYCLDVDRIITKKLDSVSISNGIVWTSDYSTMYFIDSPLNTVRAYDYDVTTATLENERIVCRNQGEGVFDGMAIDVDGLLWIAIYGGSAVKCYDPKWITKTRVEDAVYERNIVCIWRRSFGSVVCNLSMSENE